MSFDRMPGRGEFAVLAHIWFNPAATKGHDDAGKNRDFAAREMSREQISEAKRLAREWTQARD